MACAPIVVVDRPASCLFAVLVAELVEELLELPLGEQEEQHDGVGLLAELVAVGAVALGAQDPVEALDVPVARAICLPVELFQILVALELTDDAARLEGHEHLAGHLPPAAELLIG